MGDPQEDVEVAAQREAAILPGFPGACDPFLGSGQVAQVAKASLRGHGEFGARGGAMVGAGDWVRRKCGGRETCKARCPRPHPARATTHASSR